MLIAWLESFPLYQAAHCLQPALSENILYDVPAYTNSDKCPHSTTQYHSTFLLHLGLLEVSLCACGKGIPILVNLSVILRLFTFTLLPGSLRDFRHSCFSLCWKLQLISWGTDSHVIYDLALTQRIFLITEKCIQLSLHDINSLS